MDETSVTLTVYFEDPFWVGIFERREKGKLSVAKVTFGAEPKDGEIYDYLLHEYPSLRFSPAVKTEIRVHSENPKRRLRAAHKEMESSGVGTKSQQALKLMREQTKVERKQITKEEREAEEALRFEMRQRKKKEKRKGH